MLSPQRKAYIGIALLSGLMLSVMMLSGWLRHVRESLIDLLYTRHEAPAHTIIIEIDERTIARFGRWPLPRTAYAEMVMQISDADTAVIALDINFGEPSIDPEDDRILTDALRQSRTKIILNSEIEPDGSIKHPVVGIGSLNVSEGFPNIFTSSDGVVRATRYTLDDINSFSAAAAQAYSAKISETALEIPDNAVRIAYPGPNRTYAFVSAADVLDKKIPAAFFKNRIAFVGATAKDLQDYHATPFGLMSGIEIQAAAATTLIDKLSYVNLNVASAVLAVIFALMVAGLAMAIRRLALFVITITGLAFAYTMAVFISFDYYYILDLLYPNVSIFLAGALVLIAQHSATTKEKSVIEDTFSRYLAPEVIKELIDNPDALKLGGKKERLTILFSDIRNFTTVSEAMRPEQLTKFLNAYLSRMSQIVFEHKGVIDKFIGDAIMAFWGAPLPNSRQSRDAIVTALKMIDALHIFNAQNENTPRPPINIGIGINTGEATIGNMGSEKRFDYTVMGDSVNLASRLEGLSKIYGVNIIIGEETYKEISSADFTIRELDRVQVRGKKNAVTMYEIVPAFYQKAVERILPEFNKGREAYYAGRWREAMVHFDAALFKVPTDSPSRLMKERCEEFIKNPPKYWEGVYEVTQK